MSNDNWCKWSVKITTDIKNYCEQYDWCLQHHINRFQNNVINIFASFSKTSSRQSINQWATQMWTSSILNRFELIKFLSVHTPGGQYLTHTWSIQISVILDEMHLSLKNHQRWHIVPLMHIVPSVGPSEEKGVVEILIIISRTMCL